MRSEDDVVVSLTAKKVKEARLRWYGHVMRRSKVEPIRSIMELNIEVTQSGIRAG